MGDLDSKTQIYERKTESSTGNGYRPVFFYTHGQTHMKENTDMYDMYPFLL